MKKSLTTFLILMLFLLSGCNILLPWDQKDPNMPGSSPDNLVPFGEYANVGTGSDDVQVCVLEVITGEEARQLIASGWSRDGGPTIVVKFGVKVVKLKSDKFIPSDMEVLKKDGTFERGIYTYGIDETLGLEKFGSQTFGAEGSIECIMVYDTSLDECNYLKYGDKVYKDVTYFAIR